MASGAEGPKGPLVGPLGGTFQAQSKPEVVLRVLVVGEAAAGKTALLQLLEKHAAELGSARIAQQEEDRAKAAAATEVQTGPLGCPSLTHVVSLEEDSAAAAAAAAAGKAEIQASPLSALMGYRSTCGVNIVPLRCTDTSGENYLVEFWEVGGSSATKATRALLYAMPFDGVWLAYESGSEAAFRSLPAWLLEICMRADTRPSEVFFQRRQVLLQEGKKQRQKQQKLQLEEERSLGDDVELQDLGHFGARVMLLQEVVLGAGGYAAVFVPFWLSPQRQTGDLLGVLKGVFKASLRGPFKTVLQLVVSGKPMNAIGKNPVNWQGYLGDTVL
ncbi:hypothetical protein, conserved [Eimeria tenella]|uniref:Uncharacterized protein n=1 Tax=Eimeria tenella TaxID=5802 RepID=U6KR15_EIMTE|nr:hypothetical protein, conserved [Eimeria tenella]CDJ39378.1 hypothetical protein, conserved [Eimeria tenella]|eukprot:XP_013230133.1 hypothetical protein, conserved [Eimeria tenella]